MTGASIEATMRELVRHTGELLQDADLIETWTSDRTTGIVDAHRRGLTFTQYQDRIDAAVAYAESPEYAQAVWERQGFDDELIGLDTTPPRTDHPPR